MIRGLPGDGNNREKGAKVRWQRSKVAAFVGHMYYDAEAVPENRLNDSPRFEGT